MRFRTIGLLLAACALLGARHAGAVQLRAGDLVFAVDTEVVRFDPLTGNSEPIGTAYASAPTTDVALEADGMLLVAVSEELGWGIFRLDPVTGTSLPGAFQLGTAANLAVDASGNVIVFDGAVAYRFDPAFQSGEFAWAAQPPCGGVPSFAGNGVSVAPAGTVYAVSTGCLGLLAVDFVARSAISAGFAGMEGLQDVTVASDGSVVATRAAPGGGTLLVRRDPLGGESVSPVLTPSGPPAFVAADPTSSSVIVLAGADGGPKWVARIDPTTWQVTELEAPATSPPAAGFAVVPPGFGPRCDDGRDNDGDGGFDHDGAGLGPPDSHCVGHPSRNAEASACGSGAGLAFASPLLAAALRRRRAA